MNGMGSQDDLPLGRSQHNGVNSLRANGSTAAGQQVVLEDGADKSATGRQGIFDHIDKQASAWGLADAPRRRSGSPLDSQRNQFHRGGYGMPGERTSGDRIPRASEQDHAVSQDDEELSSLPVFAPLHVLVVDDTVSNRAFAVSLLEHRGHTCRLASNGREAVELFCRFGFDAVLMDIEMPEMDGIEATRLIRSLPFGGDVPIIAMTTRSEASDRERCKDSGMTDFVAKPFSARDMVIILEQAVAKVRVERISRLLNVLPVRHHMGSGTRAPSSSGVVDLDLARARLGNDEQLLRDMAGFYIEDVPVLFGELRTGLENGDAELAARSAHSLKGLSANFDARLAVEAALAVELAAKGGDLTKAAAGVDELDAEVGRVIQALKAELLGP
jgi:CheY-like chemotaxis protein